jgi:hypothetical protein
MKTGFGGGGGLKALPEVYFCQFDKEVNVWTLGYWQYRDSIIKMIQVKNHI